MRDELLTTQAPTFEVRLMRLGTTATVVVAGELDLAVAADMDRAIDDAFDGTPETVVLDLSATGFIDSAGVRSVLGAYHRAAARSVRLVVVSGTEAVERVFALCGLHLTDRQAFSLCAAQLPPEETAPVFLSCVSGAPTWADVIEIIRCGYYDDIGPGAKL